jgi:hypothetical protein
MTEIDERYKRGKIYTIRCRYDDSLVYVGSSIDNLAKRFAGHKADSKRKSYPLYNHINDDWENWYIELYEDFPCDNKEQLRKREGEVIREIATINRNIAGRSRKEYYEEYFDDNEEKRKQYYQDNRDKILEQKKQYMHDNRDKILEKVKQHRIDNIEKYKNKDKLYYEKNIDMIKQRRKQKCKCDICGAEITKVYLKKHQKTAKCMSANK